MLAGRTRVSAALRSWLPWFDATMTANQVSLTWSASYGVASEDED